MRKHTKKIMALVLAAIMMMALSVSSIAAYVYTEVDCATTDYDASKTYYTDQNGTVYTGGIDGWGGILYTRSGDPDDPVDAAEEPTASGTSTPSITIVPNNTAADTSSLAINYTYYQILEASIDTDPVVAQDGGTTTTPGKAAYYVTTEDRATQLTNTNLFNVTKVEGQTKWYVELKSTSTTAQQIIDAFEANTFDLTKFATGTFDKTAAETQAESGTLAAGYYYITSSLGTKAAVETLTAVTINEKNTYPDVDKTFGETGGTDSTNDLAGIGDTIPYTITVTIPESVASKDIKIVDTITNGLTLNTAVTVTGAAAEPAYTTATFEQTGTVAAQAAVEDDPTTTDVNEAKPAVKAAKVYTLTIPAATVIANKGKTLTFTYTATVNTNAVVLDPETNKAHLEYDNYKTVETEVVETKTLAVDIQKVDGADHTTVLAGAEFKLYDAETGGNEIKVVLKTAASDANGNINVYRVATTDETGVVIEGGTARIEGLNDKDYWLEETKAPTGYNKLETRTKITPSESTSTADIDLKIDNNKGATLPSTGGIGTTIFYIVGAVLVIGAGVVLVTRRRMSVGEQ